MRIIMTMAVVTMVGVLHGNRLPANVHYTTLTFELGQVTHLTLGAPFERAAAPQVQKTGKQDEDENEDFDKTQPATLADGNGPGKQEGGFKVEDDERMAVR
jgi:hypothetical protein